MIAKLSNSQMKVLNFYNMYIKKHGHSPTYAIASQNLNLTPAAVLYNIRHLEKKGYINAGTINSKINSIQKILQIPLLGQVACGEPITVNEHVEEYIDVGVSMLPKAGPYYGLVAKGDSMEKAGINDGDYLIIKKQAAMDNNGDICVVIDTSNREERATLKRVYKGESYLIAKPENDNIPIMYFKECEIRGKLVKVIKNY